MIAKNQILVCIDGYFADATLNIRLDKKINGFVWEKVQSIPCAVKYGGFSYDMISYNMYSYK